MELYSFILGSVTLLINLYADQYERKDLELTLKQLKSDASLPRIRTYDYIIVGGGGAGCVLANRLSKQYEVLLLEAGGDPVPATDALFNYQYVSTSPRVNYVYQTVPLNNGSAASGRVHVEHTGKMLGGSTSHHGLIFNRGHPRDFDKWAQITNDSSWSYENTLKYFKKAETYIGKYDNNEQMLEHGTKGPLTIDTAITPFLERWLSAGVELGFNRSYDPNGPQKEGFTAEAVVQKRGRRESSYTAYLKPIIEGKTSVKYRKLRIERYSEVTQILIKKSKAYGVLYKRHGIPQIAHASKEVIVAAGIVGTPLLLMKSGIGPANVLKDAGIPLVKNLPVGIGVAEHPVLSLLPYTVNQNSQKLFINLKKDLTEDALKKFQEEGKGPLVISLEGQAFVVTSRAKKAGELDWPDLVLQLGQPIYFGEQQPTYFFGIILGRPKVENSGSISLNATAYRQGLRSNEDLAILDTNILADLSDVNVMLEGIKLWLKILEETTSFRKLGIRIQDPKLQACSAHKFRSDDYWKCYISETVGLSYHLVSGCRMGYGAKDKGAVLNSKFNVFGISGLKVVDASAMPSIPNANVVAAVVMMAEKASNEILLSRGSNQT